MSRVDAKTNSLTKGLTQNLFKIPFTRDKSIKFDGSDDSIATSADRTLATKTYSFWAKSTATGSNAIFDHGDYNIGGFLFNYSYGKPLLYLENNCFRYWSDISSQDDGNWHHYLLLLSATISNSKLFCDGVEQTVHSTTSSGTASSYTTGLRLGRAGSSNFFTGSLDEFAIFDGDQSSLANELYNNGQPTDLSSYSTLDHWFRMGEGKLGTKSDGDDNLLLDQGPNGVMGSELVTNGNFGSDASTWNDWDNLTNSSGATQSGDKGILNSNVGAIDARQDVSVTAGRTYEISATVKKEVAATYVRILLSDGNNYSYAFGNLNPGTTTDEVTLKKFVTPTQSVIRLYIYITSPNPGLNYFDNISVREVQNVGTISGALIKDESTAESVPKKTVNLPSAGSLKSMSFDGTDDYVDCGTGLGDALGDNYAGSLTVSLWFKADTTSGNDGLFNVGTFSSSLGEVQISVQNNKIYYTLSNNAFVRYFSFTDTDNWNHIVVVYAAGDATNSTVYMNGSEQATTVSGSLPSAANLDFAGLKTIIGGYHSAPYLFHGSIDEVAVWNAALDGDAIRALYNAGLPTPVTTKTGAYDIYRDNLKAYYRMGDSTNPAADGTSNLLFDQTSPGLGSELITNGDFSAGETGWTKGLAASATQTATNGALVMYSGTSGDANNAMSKTSAVGTNGKVYQFELTASNFVGTGTAFLRLDSVYDSGTVISFGEGTHTIYFTAYRDFTHIRFYSGSADNYITVDNVSLKEVNGNTGTISGATIQTEAPKQIYALPPVANTKSLNFDGTNDHLITQVDSTAQPNNESRYYSWWSKSTDTGHNPVFSHGTTSTYSDKGAFHFNQHSNRTLLWMAGSVYRYWVANTQCDDGAWHHWTCRIKYNDITECELWCDGVKLAVDQTVNTGSMNAYETGIQIGKAGSVYFNGSLDEFSIHDDLDEEAIRALYNRGRPIDISKSQGAYDLSDKALHWWRMGDASSPSADGTNDIVFQGLEAESDELITNGDFETGDLTGWTANAGGQTVEVATNAAGSNALHIASDGTFCTCTQNVTTVAGAGYKLEYDLQVVSGQVTENIEGSTVTRTESGTYTRYFEAVDGVTYYQFKRVGACEFYVDNVSVKQVRGQYIGPELVTNGSFDGIADGTDPVGNIDGWVAYGSPATREIIGGQLKLTSNDTNQGIRYDATGLTVGRTYRLSFDLFGDTSAGGGGTTIYIGSDLQGSGVTNNGEGTYEFYFTASSTSRSIFFRPGNNSAGQTSFFDKLSLKEIGAVAVMTNMDSASDIQTDTPY